jgi:transcriptional regulator with XRE-family HTH domain
MVTEFGKFLRKLRIDCGEIIQDMAGKLGVTASYLSAVETGKRNIPGSWVEEISDSYSLSQESRDDLAAAAARSASSVEVEFGNATPEKRDVAILFARRFESMDTQTLNNFKVLLGKP